MDRDCGIIARVILNGKVYLVTKWKIFRNSGEERLKVWESDHERQEEQDGKNEGEDSRLEDYPEGI